MELDQGEFHEAISSDAKNPQNKFSAKEGNKFYSRWSEEQGESENTSRVASQGTKKASVIILMTLSRNSVC